MKTIICCTMIVLAMLFAGCGALEKLLVSEKASVDISINSLTITVKATGVVAAALSFYEPQFGLKWQCDPKLVATANFELKAHPVPEAVGLIKDTGWNYFPPTGGVFSFKSPPAPAEKGKQWIAEMKLVSGNLTGYIWVRVDEKGKLSYDIEGFSVINDLPGPPSHP